MQVVTISKAISLVLSLASPRALKRKCWSKKNALLSHFFEVPKFPRSITRFNATEVIINATATLEDKNGKVHISKVDLLVRDEECC